MLFSQRKGLRPVQKTLQIESLDGDLRNALWNALAEVVLVYWEPPLSGYEMRSRSREAAVFDQLAREVWGKFFKLPLDSMGRYDGSDGAYRRMRSVVLAGEWSEALDLLEFIAKAAPENWGRALGHSINQAFETENSACRFVGFEITEISSSAEIAVVESALQQASSAAKHHLTAALQKLSDRKAPDYRNSIKESISAVEAMCQFLTKQPKATLGDCIKVLKKARTLHPAFEQALDKLYGYTSDAGGIRHSLTDGAVLPTKADAQFMLISCSAFINYLLAVAAETKMKV